MVEAKEINFTTGKRYTVWDRIVMFFYPVFTFIEDCWIAFRRLIIRSLLKIKPYDSSFVDLDWCWGDLYASGDHLLFETIMKIFCDWADEDCNFEYYLKNQGDEEDPQELAIHLELIDVYVWYNTQYPKLSQDIEDRLHLNITKARDEDKLKEFCIIMDDQAKLEDLCTEKLHIVLKHRSIMW
jgi:hypothetical protein